MTVLPHFPNSQFEPFQQTSAADPHYNCIAWAANDNEKWYEPDPNGIYYWPTGISREYTIAAYISLYELLGYEKCDSGELEENFEKVAVYANESLPTHVTRQLSDGRWTSKLGINIDISHSIFSMMNGFYGNVIQYLKRRI